MVCISCGNPTQVVNSRHKNRSNQIWRRRKCIKCANIYTSEESVDYNHSWRVQSTDQGFEPFQRDKLLLSIYKSCKHRPKALDESRELCFTIIKDLTPYDAVVQSRDIINTALAILERFDYPAFVQYKAYHTQDLMQNKS